jgi:hypothetical protein
MQRCSTSLLPYTRAKASPNSPLPSRMTACRPFVFPHAAFPKPMHQPFPSGLALSISHLPVQNLPFAAAIAPQAERDEDDDFLASALMALATAFVHLDDLRLRLQAQPNAIELHHGRNIGDGVTMRLLKQGLNLIDPLVDGASSHTALQRGTPLLARARADFGTDHCQRGPADPYRAKSVGISPGSRRCRPHRAHSTDTQASAPVILPPVPILSRADRR